MFNKKLFASLLVLVLAVGLLAGCSSQDGLLSSVKKYELTTEVKDGTGGTIEVTPEQEEYEINSTVTLTAKPEENYVFAGWSGDYSGTEATAEVVMDSDKNVIADFQRKTVAAVQYFWNEAKGEVSREIMLPEGTYDYDESLPAGTEIKLTATAKPGFEFSHWEKGEEGGEVIGESSEITVTIKEVVENYFARFTCDKDLVTEEDSDYGKVVVTNSESLYSTEKGHVVLNVMPKKNGVFDGWTNLPAEEYIVEHSAPEVEDSRSITLRGFGDADPKANFENVQGAFEVVNSWGANWGPNSDGTMKMSYAAAANAGLLCVVQEKDAGYEPQAIATFDLSGSTSWRSNVGLEVFAMSGGSIISSKTFYPFTFYGGGSQYFPDNKMVMDITELLTEARSLGLDNVDIGFAVNNTEAYGKVKLNSFGVEVYADGYSTDPANASDTYSAPGLPVEIINAGPSFDNALVTSVDITGIDPSAVLGTTNTLDKYAREITSKDVEKIKSVTEEGDLAHRTGLIPMNEDQWKTVMEKDSMKMLGDLPAPTKETVNLMENDYFPPIGNQAAEGSCVAWGVSYYARTYNEAQERGWDYVDAEGNRETYEEANKSHLMSPEFTYQLINDGQDGGAIYFDALQVNKHMGVASLETMPYDDGNATAWGSEEAWRESVMYRNPGPHKDVGNGYYLVVDSVEDINTLKSVLEEDYLVTISIDANLYGPEVWTVENYVNPMTNHANTIAGFDDTFTDY